MTAVFGSSFAQTSSSAASSKIKPLISEATEALEKKDFSNAKTILLRALQIAPGDYMAHSLMGIIADRENDLKAAEKHFGIAALRAPDLPETRNNYGAILLKLKRSKEAAREFTASLKINPNQLSALINLAQIRFAENNLRAARELFEKAKAIQSDVEITRSLVIIALRLNERERAAKDFQEYSAAAKSADLKAASRHELGAALLENGLINEAIQELQIAVELEPSNVDLIIQLSQAFASRNDVKSAGRLLETAAARGLDDAKIYAALADVYEAAGYMENAIPAIRLAIEKAPRNIDYRFRYGMLLINSKAPAASAIRLEEAVKEFPQAAQLWFALGIAYFNISKTSEARTALQKALALEPKMLPAMAYLANTFVEAAQYEEAAKIYERAIAVSEGKHAALHFLLADTLLNITTADAKQIENVLKRAIELDANLAAAHSALGTLYIRQGRWTEAGTALERAVRLQPEDTKSLYQLGRVYARLKRADESRAVMEKFKQLSDAQKEQKEASRRELVRRLANVRF